MTRPQKILIGTVVAAAVVSGIFTLVPKNTLRLPEPAPHTPPPPSADVIDVSRLVFDAKTTIPDTGVTFSYPRNGFYGDGITLAKSDRSPFQIFQSVANYSVTALWEGSILTHQGGINLSIYKLTTEKTLEDAIATIVDYGQMDESLRRLGHYQDVNGSRFFLAPSSDQRGIKQYYAYILVNGRLLAVTFSGGFAVTGPDSVPDLVTAFLNHLDFTCAADCSVNSAPIIEEHMPTEGQ